MDKALQEDIEDIIQKVGIPINDFEGEKVLITGASGFLGSWFIAVFHYLNSVYKHPVEVLAMDSFIAADKNNALMQIKDKNIYFQNGDCSKVDVVNRAYTTLGNPDYIIHAAGIASPVHYRKYPIETIDGMVLGLRWLLEKATLNPITSFLNFSSSEMYGNPTVDQVPTSEDYYGHVSCIGPRSCYDEAKRLGETYCSSYHRIHNVPVKWVRPFNVYGPGMRVNDDRVAPKFIFQALKGESLTVHKPAIQTRTLCYITDAMAGFFKALLVGKNGEVYNIGNESPEISMQELALKVTEKFGGKVKIDYVEMPTEYPRDQAQRRCPDLAKARNELNYNPKVDLDKGLDKMIDWCKQVLSNEKTSRYSNPCA